MTASAKRRMPLAHLAVRPPPLYVKVADQLRRELLAQRKPGDKLESGPDLAKRLGVSVLTVREAVNALTQEGLLERARGSGTYVRDPGMPPGGDRKIVSEKQCRFRSTGSGPGIGKESLVLGVTGCSRRPVSGAMRHLPGVWGGPGGTSSASDPADGRGGAAATGLASAG